MAGVEVFPGDVAEPDLVHQAMAGAGIVFHLAALVSIPYSFVAPAAYLHTNTAGTLHVLEAARDLGVQRVVVTSSSEVYGTPDYVPIDEGHPLRAQSPYAASKIGADALARSFHRAYGLPVAIIRPFNTYGPRQSLRAVIPTIISQALTCSVVTLGALEPVRDFTFVQDTVAGFLAVGQRPEATGRVINVGSGSGISIGQLAELIFELTGYRREIRLEEARVRPRSSEVMRLVADASKAQALLDWRPTVSLREGLGRTIRWIQQRDRDYLCRAQRYHT
jgi:dTDP-glucose 4,6-dehydratase